MAPHIFVTLEQLIGGRPQFSDMGGQLPPDLRLRMPAALHGCNGLHRTAFIHFHSFAVPL